MSLVADVIASTKHGGVQTDGLVVEMEQLFKQSEEARVSVCQGLSSHYISLVSSFNDITNVRDKLRKCLQEIDTLDSQVRDEVIPSLEGSASEIGRITQRWKEMKAEIEATELLLNIHTLMENSHTALANSEYIDVVDNLNKIEDLLDEASGREVESQLEILSALREELVLKRTDLVFQLGEVWDKFLSFSEEELRSGTKVVNLYFYDLEFKKSEREIQSVRQMFAAFNALGELRRYIRLFGKNLLEFFIKPILCECGELNVTAHPELGVSAMQVQKGTKSSKVNDTTSALEALERLDKMFQFLNEQFSKYSISEDNKDVSIISVLGAEIGDEFTKLVLNSCLEESVPCDSKDLQSLNAVEERVQKFHCHLVTIGFYGEDHKSLINYVANLETVYGNKTCASILKKARDLIVKSLGVTATVGQLSPDAPLVAYDEFGAEMKETTLRLQNLSANTFNIPKCKVSVSICELVNLIYDTLEEACTSVPEFAGRLFYTVRNILSLYRHIVPVAHAHALATMPQHAALVHNNSLYISHHALLLGHHYKNRLPSPLRTASLTTVDLGYLIRSSGCEVFLKAMQNIKKELLETLRRGLESSSSKSNIAAVNPLHTSVQECLKQLKRVQNDWQHVLPHAVYVKAIGTLIGSVVEDLVLRITALEEISADDGISLTNVLSLLTSNAPSLFNENDESAGLGEAVKEVRLWEKLEELIVVLGASLFDLHERWSDGKGPLAHHFTPGEVKHLIKAIFQNTERRAQLLAKIN